MLTMGNPNLQCAAVGRFDRREGAGTGRAPPGKCDLYPRSTYQFPACHGRDLRLGHTVSCPDCLSTTLVSVAAAGAGADLTGGIVGIIQRLQSAGGNQERKSAFFDMLRNVDLWRVLCHSANRIHRRKSWHRQLCKRKVGAAGIQPRHQCGIFLWHLVVFSGASVTDFVRKKSSSNP